MPPPVITDRARRPRVAWHLWFWLVALLANGGAVVRAEAPAAKEYEVKAAFLYNFTRFVEWPADALGPSHRPFVIGVIGRESFRDDLERTVRGRKVMGRAVVVKTFHSAAESVGAHLVFVTEGAEAQARGVWPRHGVLTVGESESFLEQGGTIAFLFEDDRLRFAIDAATAERTGLKISAQMQKLAVSWRRTR